MEQSNRNSYPQPLDQYLSDELEQVYPRLSPSPSISAAADANKPFEIDADHDLPGFFDLSHEEFERQVLLDLATNPSGSYQQIIDRDPYERLGSIASESEQVNPQLPPSPSDPAADANGPRPVNADNLRDLSPEKAPINANALEEDSESSASQTTAYWFTALLPGGKGFSRQDNLTQHLRRSHGENIVKKHFKVHGSNWGFDDV
ncbi:hypothetical protein DFP73DRAFT_600572 [Morchella snyderi]|nr:hypothetical protein DFP73DRAFT_600572 [Morchella snyderi]